MKLYRYFSKVIRQLIPILLFILCVRNASGLHLSMIGADLDGVLKCDHFIIFYDKSINGPYIKDFSDKCEDYYALITDRLGFDRYNFWLWDDRVNICVYKDKATYMEKSGRGEWSAGSVNYKKKIIKTFYQEEDFFDAVLPHELTHIVLREFIGFKSKTPLWFDEGVAVINERNCLQKYMFVAKCLLDRGFYLPVDKMDNITNDQLVTPSVFYPMAGSIIIFLFEKNGKKGFAELCSELKRNVKFYEAMDSIYGIKNADELNQCLLDYLRSVSYEDIKNNKGFSVEWP